MQTKTKLFKVEYYRRKYGITQTEMAGFLGVIQGTYSAKVNGRTGVTLDEMMIIHNFLNKKAKKAGDEYLSLDDIFLD